MGKVEFNYERYMKEKIFQILNQNEKVKLSTKTLIELANIGFRLIPYFNGNLAKYYYTRKRAS
jgi:hypothetical protein